MCWTLDALIRMRQSSELFSEVRTTRDLRSRATFCPPYRYFRSPERSLNSFLLRLKEQLFSAKTRYQRPQCIELKRHLFILQFNGGNSVGSLETACIPKNETNGIWHCWFSNLRIGRSSAELHLSKMVDLDNIHWIDEDVVGWKFESSFERCRSDIFFVLVPGIIEWFFFRVQVRDGGRYRLEYINIGRCSLSGPNKRSATSRVSAQFRYTCIAQIIVFLFSER
jgi:hypothetical protein